MNKAQLVDAIAVESGITKVDAKRALDAIIKITGDVLLQGDKIALTGFGTFSVVRKPERSGRNPRTGASLKIASKNAVKFRPSVELNAKVQ